MGLKGTHLQVRMRVPPLSCTSWALQRSPAARPYMPLTWHVTPGRSPTHVGPLFVLSRITHQAHLLCVWLDKTSYSASYSKHWSTLLGERLVLLRVQRSSRLRAVTCDSCCETACVLLATDIAEQLTLEQAKRKGVWRQSWTSGSSSPQMATAASLPANLLRRCGTLAVLGVAACRSVARELAAWLGGKRASACSARKPSAQRACSALPRFVWLRITLCALHTVTRVQRF